MFGGRTRPVAADGWASPPVGRNIRWVAKTVADALREPNTHRVERVSLANRRMKTVRSGWEALADARQEHNTRCVGRVSIAKRGTSKGKVVWPGVLSPASVGRSRLAVSDR